MATASFPCNDLSLAGSRKGLGGKQSSAFWGFVNIIKELKARRPPIILLENVIGFITSHQGKDFKNALVALNNLGYSVDAFIVDAAHFVPQSRQRLFVVAQREDLNTKFRVMETSHFYESNARPKNLAKFILGNPEINWKLFDLPAFPNRIENLV